MKKFLKSRHKDEVDVRKLKQNFSYEYKAKRQLGSFTWKERKHSYTQN